MQYFLAGEPKRLGQGGVGCLNEARKREVNLFGRLVARGGESGKIAVS